MRLCTCAGTLNGVSIVGYCELQNKCHGTSVSGGIGGAGGAGGSLGSGMQALQGIMSLANGLNTLTGGGAGGGGGATSGLPTGYCLQYYYVNTPSSNPCAIYQPSSSGSLSTTIQPNLVSDLLSALGGGSPSPISGAITNTNTNTNTNANTNQNNQVVVTQIRPGTNVGTSSSLGLTGNVRVNPGATVFANLRQGVSEIAGFFGGNTFGGDSQSALSRVCAARPWAGSGLAARLAPDTFFDGLCRAAGYQVGTVAPGGGGARPTNSFTSTTEQPSAPVIPVGLQPAVDIRAEPSSVRLGTRTYIFWTSRDVASCSVKGPSFEQYTLSGAGATVPITGDTTYTVECTAADGRKVNDTVTVRLAI